MAATARALFSSCREVGSSTISSPRALASARGLLIVDEPTSRQDENNARAVAAMLAAAAHEDGQTVLCATHDPAVIRQADNVVTLDGSGHLYRTGPVPALVTAVQRL